MNVHISNEKIFCGYLKLEIALAILTSDELKTKNNLAAQGFIHPSEYY